MRYLHLIRIESEQFLVQMAYSSLFQRSEVRIIFPFAFAFCFKKKVHDVTKRSYFSPFQKKLQVPEKKKAYSISTPYVNFQSSTAI